MLLEHFTSKGCWMLMQRPLLSHHQSRLGWSQLSLLLWQNQMKLAPIFWPFVCGPCAFVRATGECVVFVYCDLIRFMRFSCDALPTLRVGSIHSAHPSWGIFILRDILVEAHKKWHKTLVPSFNFWLHVAHHSAYYTKRSPPIVSYRRLLQTTAPFYSIGIMKRGNILLQLLSLSPPISKEEEWHVCSVVLFSWERKIDPGTN